MTPGEVVVAYFDALDREDMDALSALVTEDYRKTSTRRPDPMTLKAYTSAVFAVNAGFSQVRHNLLVERVEGNTVHASVAVSGLHDKRLHVPEYGIGPLEATGRTFQLPREGIIATVRDGRIATHHTLIAEHGGFEGILAQLTAPED